MLKNEDYINISRKLKEEEQLSGIAIEIYYSASYPRLRKDLKKYHPEYYKVLTTGIKHIPTFLNDKNPGIKLIAIYRLEHKR